MDLYDDNLVVHWFRRDLRLEDNPALMAAHASGLPVLGLFILDQHILDRLPPDDPRVTFIHQTLEELRQRIRQEGGDLLVLHGTPEQAICELVESYPVQALYANRDYEPYALERDQRVEGMLKGRNISMRLHQDHVLLEPGTVLKPDGSPYSVFTSFKKRWLAVAAERSLSVLPFGIRNWAKATCPFPELGALGLKRSTISVKPACLDRVADYGDSRNILADEGTLLGPHLRFGTISIRQAYEQASDPTFLSQLIWREFFIHILFFHPRVVEQSFKPRYDRIAWLNDPEAFERWSQGQTGYPLVDAGMRQLNQTGYMHNRARMVTASFLTKHLLIDWRLGEQYFALKLLDYELASNNGSWQWASGSGCDAAPYFRVFNPGTQLERFDPNKRYVNRWVPELGKPSYPQPIVDHRQARARALNAYKEAVSP